MRVASRFFSFTATCHCPAKTFTDRFRFFPRCPEHYESFRAFWGRCIFFILFNILLFVFIRILISSSATLQSWNFWRPKPNSNLIWIELFFAGCSVWETLHPVWGRVFIFWYFPRDFFRGIGNNNFSQWQLGWPTNNSFAQTLVPINHGAKSTLALGLRFIFPANPIASNESAVGFFVCLQGHIFSSCFAYITSGAWIYVKFFLLFLMVFVYYKHLLSPMKSQFARNKSKENLVFPNAYITTRRSAKILTHTTSATLPARDVDRTDNNKSVWNANESRSSADCNDEGDSVLMSDVTKTLLFESEGVPPIDSGRSLLYLV